MTIEVFVTPEMKRQLKGIRASFEVTGEKWTLRQIYSNVLAAGIETRVPDPHDMPEEYEAYKTAIESPKA